MLSISWTLGMILVLATFVHLGFAFLIWAYSGKESGATKIVGKIIAVVIVLLSLVILFNVYNNVRKVKKMMMEGACPMMRQDMKGPMPMDMMGKGAMHKEEMKKDGEMGKHMGKMEKEKGKKHHKK